jgi:uncharacterized protein (TIGR02270 family)
VIGVPLKPVLEHIVSQHAEEAAFLWLLRDRAVSAPQYFLADLARLDSRIEAHIDGLRIAGEPGWEICKEQLTFQGPGEIFGAGVIALGAGKSDRFDTVMESASRSYDLLRALISAHGWLPYYGIEDHVKRLLTARPPEVRRIGIAASAIHRRDPGRVLGEGIESGDKLLAARSLKAAGELGRIDLVPLIREHLRDDDETCRYEAAWSGTLLGDGRSAEVMEAIVGSMGRHWEEGAAVLCRKMVSARFHGFFGKLSENPSIFRPAVAAAGAMGDPVAIPWLLDRMALSALARPAGEAFSMITAIDMWSREFEGKIPEGFQSGPTDFPEDDDVSLDQDEGLAWPDIESVRAWWVSNEGSFQKGRRYLLGRPITPEWLQQTLRCGRQKVRAASALEYALMHPGTPLYEVRSPGFLQK